AVAVDSPTQITVTVSPGTIPAASLAPAGSSLVVQVTNPEGCFAPYKADPIDFGISGAKAFANCQRLGTLAIDPRFRWQFQHPAVTITNNFSLPVTKAFSGGAPHVSIIAPVVGQTTPPRIAL